MSGCLLDVLSAKALTRGEVMKLVGPLAEAGNDTCKGTDSEESDTDVGPSNGHDALEIVSNAVRSTFPDDVLGWCLHTECHGMLQEGSSEACSSKQ